MIKYRYICLISELLDTNDFCDEINIIANKIYLIEYVNKHVYYLYDNNENYLGEIWGTISDHFITLAEWREMQINKILDDL
jgi:hypothetical protein